MGRLIRDGTTSSCASSKFPPGLNDSSERYYRNHTFRSFILEPACVTVTLTTACTGANEIFSVAYDGTFDPADPRTRWAADLGQSPPIRTSYSFNMDGGKFFSVVVHSVTQTATATACPSYNLSLDSNRPWATAIPTVSGSAAVGDVLTGSDGVWRETPAVQRQWRRCDSAGAGCSDIPGATTTTYTVTDADLGHTLRYVNLATDAGGTSTTQSAVVDPYIPFKTSTESIAVGDRVHNGILARSGLESRCGVPLTPPGIANPALPFLFETFPITSLLNEPVCLVVRTVPNLAMCSGGVTPTIYNPVFLPADLTANYAAYSAQPGFIPNSAGWPLPAGGSAELVVSRGTNGISGCGAYNLTLGAAAPFATERPAIDGTAIERGTLAANNGTWSGTPTFSHSWMRCDADGAACTPIDGADGPSYSPTAADIGARLRLRVIASQGQVVSSDSEPSSVVAASPPPAGGPLADVDAPRATMRLRSRDLTRALRLRRIPVAVTCDEQCTALVRIRIRLKLARRLGLARSIVITRAGGTVPAGAKKVLRAKLSKRVRRALRERRSLRITLRGTFTDAAGNTARLSGKSVLKRRRPR